MSLRGLGAGLRKREIRWCFRWANGCVLRVLRRNSVTVGYRFPPGPALGGRKQGLSEMRCKGQLETENERPSKNIRMEIGVKPLES